MRTRLSLLALVVPSLLAAQRTVTGNRIASIKLPAATMVVDSSMEYLGTQTFDLYHVATAEQHFYVQRDGGRVKRLLWIQFEGYLPGNSHTYNYADSTIEHSGRRWHQRIAAQRIPDTEPRPDSDGAKARAFLRSKGLTIGPEVMTERLVWMVDGERRNELMVIYLEDLTDQKLTAEALGEKGAERARWPALAAAFQTRAVAAFTIEDR